MSTNRYELTEYVRVKAQSSVCALSWISLAEAPRHFDTKLVGLSLPLYDGWVLWGLARHGAVGYEGRTRGVDAAARSE